jgi:hypothetical protein
MERLNENQTTNTTERQFIITDSKGLDVQVSETEVIKLLNPVHADKGFVMDSLINGASFFVPEESHRDALRIVRPHIHKKGFKNVFGWFKRS